MEFLFTNQPVARRHPPRVTAATAFSLIELSIVLVILGLLTGGILAGQSLIQASELRSVVMDFNKFQTASYTFRDKYFYLPGDMVNASAFWGGGSTTLCPEYYAASTPMRTCNGDGNGRIDNSTYSQEAFRYWQHLTNAGLIEGQYSGAEGMDMNASYTSVMPGINIPKAKLRNGAYTTSYLNQPCNGASGWLGICGGFNRFIVGKIDSFTNRLPLLKPEEAWNIDVKMDDSRPGYGSVQSTASNNPYTPNCTTTAFRETAEYNLTSNDVLCIGMILLK